MVVDAGDFVWKNHRLSLEQRPQQIRKAQVLLEGFALVGMDGVVPGDGDLSIGIETLATLAGDAGVPLLAANLVCDGKKPFPGGRVVERGGLRFGIAGVVGEDVESADCMVTPPVAALETVVAELGSVDLWIVLSHGSDKSDEALASVMKGNTLLVNGGEGAKYTTPRELPGGVLQLAAGRRGKGVGVARGELHPGGSGFVGEDAKEALEKKIERGKARLASGQKRMKTGKTEQVKGRAKRQVEHYEKELTRLQSELEALQTTSSGVAHRLQNEIVGLGRSIEDDPATKALLDEANKDIGGIEAPKGDKQNHQVERFVGSAVCQACHAEQAAQYETTRHASASATLEQLGRTADRACFTCHVTGAHHEDGPQSPADVHNDLKNVGCESCHGPGQDHVLSANSNKMVALPSVGVCVQCHDGEQDEGRFDPIDYFVRVRH